MNIARIFLFRFAPVFLCIFLQLFHGASPLFAASPPSSAVSLETMAGQMLMVGFRGLTLAPGSPIYEDVTQGRLAGVIFFDYDVALKKPLRNIQSASQVKSLVQAFQKIAPVPLFFAVDQEGGRVARLKPKFGFPPTLSAAKLGALGDLRQTQDAGYSIGEALKSAGLNLDFAPVVDVNTNPENPVIGKLERSFSRDPEKVAQQAGAFIQGLHQAGRISCIKHFPGHGSAWNDSHLGMVDVTETWRESELLPYQQLIEQGRCDMVMTAHIFNSTLDPEHPATLSKSTITGVLRRRLGFDGVVVSDDMQMKAMRSYYSLEQAVELAVNAGVDILLFGNNLNYDPGVAKRAHALLLRMVHDERISEERIRQSYERVMRLKKRLPPL